MDDENAAFRHSKQAAAFDVGPKKLRASESVMMEILTSDRYLRGETSNWNELGVVIALPYPASLPLISKTSIFPFLPRVALLPYGTSNSLFTSAPTRHSTV